MPRDDDSVHRFLRAVHRRQVALRILESAALGTLAGCAVAVVLVGVMLWRGQDAWAVAGATLVVGTIAGAVWGRINRPSILASAGEADRQLRTADLLGTAWALHAQPRASDPSFQQAVLALAHSRCRSLSPSSVVLRRLGVRAWGGVALAVAFVATLAAMSSGPLQAGKRDSGTRASVDATRRAAPSRPLVPLVAGDAGGARQARQDQSPGDDRAIGSAELPRDTADSTDTANADTKARKTDATDGADAGGAGSASASDRRSSDERPVTPPTSDAKRAQSPGKLGGPGVGRPTLGEITDDPAASAGGIITGVAGLTPAEPWRSSSWSNAVEAAGQDVRAGRVPDAHRDLVRGYFDRTDVSR